MIKIVLTSPNTVGQASRLSIGVGFIRPVLSLQWSAATVAISFFHYVIPVSLYVIPEKSGIQNIYCPHLFFVFFPTLIPRTITIRYTYTLNAVRYTLICTLHLLYFLSLSFLPALPHMSFPFSLLSFPRTRESIFFSLVSN